jgi:predicted RNase H-like nuclease
VLDAAAAAWSAHRIATGCAVSYPDPPQRTDDGDEIAIWA